MTAPDRRVVITGIGLISPLGCDPETVWQAMSQGKTAIGPIRSFDVSGLPVRFAGEVHDFDAREHLPKEARKNLRVMARPIQMAVTASHLVLTRDGNIRDSLDPTRFGVVFGAGLIATELIDLVDAARICIPNPPSEPDMDLWGTEGLGAIQPLWMLKYLPNMLACQVSIMYDAQAHNNSITEGEVASLLAVGEGYRILQRNRADFFLVGGAESKINPLSLTRQCLYEHISRRNDAPEKACRPFDKERDGHVVGEGACVLAIEDLDHARKRGAKIIAEIVGFGAAFDLRQDGDGLARAMQTALKEAGITPDDIDHINAHGMSTLESDIWEARGINKVFGHCKKPVPVVAPKSYFGNAGAGGGTLELAVSLLALQKGEVPPTLNYEFPDPECPVHVISGKPHRVTKPHVLKLSFNQLGQASALVVRSW